MHKSFFDHPSRLTEPPNQDRQLNVKLQPFTSSRPKAAAVVKRICHLTVMSHRHCCAYSNTVEMECVLMVSSFIVKHLKRKVLCLPSKTLLWHSLDSLTQALCTACIGEYIHFIPFQSISGTRKCWYFFIVHSLCLIVFWGHSRAVVPSIILVSCCCVEI